MAKRAVQVSECDRCGKEPAHTWQITGPDGAPREIELCDQHASPIANVYALARPVPKRRARATSPRRQQTPKPPVAEPKAPAAPLTLASLPKPDPEPIWR